MKKRILSLLCVLALCLGLLPTAALAAAEGAPAKLYVGDQNVRSEENTTYWVTTDSGGLTQSSENDAWNVKYDPNTATLTLKDAKISGIYDENNNPFTAGIYAKGSSNQAVALTIELIGTNTITGSYGIYLDGHQGNTICTNASVLIKNGNESGESGSLTVNGTSSYGIFIISGTGNASLTIENASVVAKTTSSYGGSGVCVQSGASATGSPQLSLAVNGGSLTASGTGSRDGILFYVGSSEATGATTSLTVTDNAIVDARTGGISASRITETLPTPTPTGDNSSGIVFDGTEGTVYGDVTLDEPLTIDQDETLTIPQGTTLNTNGNLTNNGTIVNEGGTLNGEPGGTIVTVSAPAITTESLPDGTAGQSYTATLEATGNNITWSVTEGALPAGLTLNESTGEITGTPATEGQFPIKITATNSVGSIDRAYTLNIKPATVSVTSVKLDKTELPLVVGGNATLIATVEPADATDRTVTWESSDSDVATVDPSGTVKAVAPGTATITATANDGSGQKASCTVTVTQPVTGVTLDQTELSLYTGESQTLTAKVEPADATNQDVTWSSSDNTIATVKDGTVTAVKAGEATITVTTADGGKQATCKVKVTQATYNISAEGSLKFDAAYKGYAQPTAKTVTVTNTGNQTLTLEQPASTNSFEVGTLSKTQLAPDEKATFTVQPKADLAVDSYKESISISGSNGNHTVSTSVDATFAVVDINDTSVDNKLTVTSGISAGISGTAFDTADTVKAELTRVLVQDAAYTAGNTAFYDVKLQYSLDGGNTWFEATEATFPKEGITVTLPYPSGTGKDTHNFRVVHMFTATSARLGTTAGNTETPAVTKTDSGLQVTLKGLSPVVIGWDKIETQSSTSSAASAPSDNTTYYTCPSCGYHNWTATEAGYRCDNCGYLESVKQLSGYGNVKGTYTPGSSAAAAASTVPQTGDESNPVLWTVLLLVSGLALGGLAIARRKKQQ